MIKASLHKVFSVTLSWMVLFSTLSFTVEKHYCGDNLVDTAIFTKANNCGMDMDAVAANYKEKKSCCKDEVEVFKGQDKLKKTSFEDLQLDQKLIFTAFTHSYFYLFEGIPEQVIPYKYYTPPNLIADIQVRYQVFII